ncbi:hypothetical protein SFC23_03060 [Shouchella clausii]|uniref:hypothetical protein n=1 Tax=Shouchella clausii TaxID=79880 RepID=UPI0039830B51
MIRMDTYTRHQAAFTNVSLFHVDVLPDWVVVQLAFELDPPLADMEAPGAQLIIAKDGSLIEATFQEERCDEPTIQLEEEEAKQLHSIAAKNRENIPNPKGGNAF